MQEETSFSKQKCDDRDRKQVKNSEQFENLLAPFHLYVVVCGSHYLANVHILY